MSEKNLSTFSSKRVFGHKKYLFFPLFFYASFFVSIALFLMNPSLFYWRSWEYFDEIGYKIPNKLKWEGYEKGDGARRYIYSFQDSWKTIVTSDNEGFRSVPYPADKFPILIFGDSNTWGCGLSDDETIPWLVATHLNVPVFNGARFPYTLTKLLNNPRLKEAKIIVELVTQHLLNQYIFRGSDSVQPNFEVYAKEKSYSNFFDISPARYFIPLKCLRSSLVKFNFLNEFNVNKIDIYSIPHDHKYSLNCSEENFELAIEKIRKRAALFESLGYKYVFGLIPEKGVHLGYYLDENDQTHEKALSKILQEAQINYIDLCQVFRNFEHPRLLFLPTDVHINEVGAAVIAREVADFLLNTYPEICLEHALSEKQLVDAGKPKTLFRSNKSAS